MPKKKGFVLGGYYCGLPGLSGDHKMLGETMARDLTCCNLFLGSEILVQTQVVQVDLSPFLLGYTCMYMYIIVYMYIYIYVYYVCIYVYVYV